MLRSSVGVFGRVLERQVVARNVFSHASQLPLYRHITTSSPYISGAARRIASVKQFPRSANFYQSVRPRLAQGPRSPMGTKRSFHSSKSRRSESIPKEEAQPSSLSARLKKLSKEYGWTAVGVYMALSILDFPFCFMLVRVLGTDRIAAAEELVVSKIQKIVPDGVQEKWHEFRDSLKKKEKEELGDNNISEDVEMAGWGVKEAEERHESEASLATQLALAYAIHKSFIFVRVPLTAAILPKVVKVLRSWGWQIGKKRPR